MDVVGGYESSHATATALPTRPAQREAHCPVTPALPRTTPSTPFGPWLVEASRRRADREAVVDGRERLSYERFADEAFRAGRAMAATGAHPGDRIALWANNFARSSVDYMSFGQRILDRERVR
ncbi:AMP-binding protein [Rhodococcus sp. 1168]|uniref:AMP-binding protein n=1 Tax=Rhodococcus sp. 1168 TaxID=2018041 RepID=UPI0034CD64CB